jgi:hypothetical protein
MDFFARCFGLKIAPPISMRLTISCLKKCGKVVMFILTNISFEKSKFFETKVEFLGFVASDKGLTIFP